MNIIFLLTGEIGVILHEEKDIKGDPINALIEFPNRWEYLKATDYIKEEND